MASAAYPARGLHGRVVHDLGLRIVGGSYQPGEALPNEDDLSAELGVSRSVVREAVKVLAGKGLIEVRPRTGTRVRGRSSWHLLDPDVVGWQFEDVARSDELREVHEVRLGIAVTAARLAAVRRTDEIDAIDAHLRRIEAAEAEPEALRTADLDFHGAVVAAAHNTLLLHVNAVVQVGLEAGPPSAVAADSGTMSLRRAVAEAVRARDPEGAAGEMRKLLAAYGDPTGSGDPA